MTQQASTRVRSLHKMSLGTCLGGTIFGLMALNPSVKRISDRRERGRVLNEAESDLDATLAGIKNLLLGGARHHHRLGDRGHEDRPASPRGRNACRVGDRAR